MFIVKDTSYNLSKIEKLILNSDVYRPKEEIFTLRYALASTLTSSIDKLLSSEGSYQLDEATNTIMVSDKEARIEEIAAFVAEIDTPAKQLQSKSFSIKFVPVDNVASLLEGSLSAEGRIEVDSSANTLVLTEINRNFAKLEERILSLDVYQPKEEIFTLEYALPSAVRSLLMNYLGPEDSFETNDQKNEIILNSDPYTSRKIRGLLDSLDTLEAQSIEEKHLLKYLSPEEAWNKLKFKNTVSKYASFVDSYEVEKKGSAEEKEVAKEYVRIPSEIDDNSETERVRTVVSSLEENIEDKQSVGYIIITDLKRNQQKIREAIEEMNRGEEIINRTFYIGEGSLERIALAMANILGIEPGDIEGLEPRGEWLQMEVPTLEINLGTVGPR
jgi:type II secretory pathway component GspD/PulD (secretin)